jgi:hypothetical protein
MVNLVGRLNALGRDVMEKYGDVNWGGCCVFAALVGKRLEKIAPVKIRVGNSHYVGNSDAINLDEVRNNIRSNVPSAWNQYDVHFAHVIIEFVWRKKTYHYDSCGVTVEDAHTVMGNYPILKGSLTVKEAAELSSTQRGWNHMFDRGNIPDIERMINEAFDKIDQLR